MNTITCPIGVCDEPVIRIMRIQWRGNSKSLYFWRYDREGDTWSSKHDGIFDEGSHIHLFCAAHVRHEESGCGPRCLRAEAQCLVHQSTFSSDEGEFCPGSYAPDDWDWDSADFEPACDIRYIPAKDHVDHERKYWPRDLPPTLRSVVFDQE